MVPSLQMLAWIQVNILLLKELIVWRLPWRHTKKVPYASHALMEGKNEPPQSGTERWH
jgi:hypothetical protein